MYCKFNITQWELCQMNEVTEANEGIIIYTLYCSKNNIVLNVNKMCGPKNFKTYSKTKF